MCVVLKNTGPFALLGRALALRNKNFDSESVTHLRKKKKRSPNKTVNKMPPDGSGRTESVLYGQMSVML